MASGAAVSSPGRASAVAAAAAAAGPALGAAARRSGPDGDLRSRHCPGPLRPVDLAATADGSVWVGEKIMD